MSAPSEASAALAPAFNVAALGKKPPRKSSPPFSLRHTPRERARLEEMAGNQPIGAYVRARLFGEDADTRRKLRRPRVDDQKLAFVLAELGRSRLAQNMNQIARAANTGTLEALLSLLDIGYEKIGLILTDEAPAQGRTKNNMTILSAGKAAAQVKDAAADNGTRAMIVRLVRHVYDKELGIPAGAREAEQRLAALRGEREALIKRQQGIEAERLDSRQRSSSLAEERAFIETLLASKGSPDAFASKSDGRFVNPLLEAVIAAYESQIGKRVDRADTAQVSSALQARLTQMDGARQKSN